MTKCLDGDRSSLTLTLTLSFAGSYPQRDTLRLLDTPCEPLPDLASGTSRVCSAGPYHGYGRGLKRNVALAADANPELWVTGVPHLTANTASPAPVISST